MIVFVREVNIECNDVLIFLVEKEGRECWSKSEVEEYNEIYIDKD